MGRLVLRFNLPISTTAAARTLRSAASWRSSSSICLRQSVMSMGGFSSRSKARYSPVQRELTRYSRAAGQELSYEFCHSRGLASWILFDGVNDGTAHHCAFGEFAHADKLRRSRNSETNGHRKLTEAADTRDESGGVSSHLLALAGDAGAGDRIDKTG